MATPILLNKTIVIDINGVPTIVKVACKGSWENDGIGSYEFHGYKGYDRGNDYFLIDTWEVEVPGLTLTERQSTQIDDEILVKLSDWEHEYTKEYIDKLAKEREKEPKQTNESNDNNEGW